MGWEVTVSRIFIFSLYLSAGAVLSHLLPTLRPMVRHHRISSWASSQRSEACSGTEDHDRPARSTMLGIQQRSCAHAFCHVDELSLTFRIVSHGQSSRCDGSNRLLAYAGLFGFCSTLEEKGNSLRRMNHWHTGESDWFLGDIETSWYLEFCSISLLLVDTWIPVCRFQKLLSHIRLQARTMGRVTSEIGHR